MRARINSSFAYEDRQDSTSGSDCLYPPYSCQIGRHTREINELLYSHKWQAKVTRINKSLYILCRLNGAHGPVSGTHSQMSRSDIAHLHLRIFEIERVGQSAHILPILVKEGVKRGKSTSFFYFCKRQELGHEKSGK